MSIDTGGRCVRPVGGSRSDAGPMVVLMAAQHTKRRRVGGLVGAFTLGLLIILFAWATDRGPLSARTNTDSSQDVAAKVRGP
jgi:hypothetical protein